MNKLPKNIPLFPLSGALLLPTGNLPLNIFEPRYISMVNYALRNDKLIGMIQPKNDNTKKLYSIGCIGKITSFSQTTENRYIINLNGLSRFTIIKELKNSYKFKIFDVKLDSNEKKFNEFNKKIFNKKLFIKKIKLYFRNRGITADWESLYNIDEKSLIIMIASICPFKISEKQMLLESKNINSLVETSIALFDFEINQNSNYETIN